MKTHTSGTWKVDMLNKYVDVLETGGLLKNVLKNTKQGWRGFSSQKLLIDN